MGILSTRFWYIAMGICVHSCCKNVASFAVDFKHGSLVCKHPSNLSHKCCMWIHTTWDMDYTTCEHINMRLWAGQGRCFTSISWYHCLTEAATWHEVTFVNFIKLPEHRKIPIVPNVHVRVGIQFIRNNKQTSQAILWKTPFHSLNDALR